MKEITLKQIYEWNVKVQEQGFTLTDVIVGKPKDNTLIVGNVEHHLRSFQVGRPVTQVMGLNIWVDDKLSENTGYLIDANRIIRIKEKKQ